MGELFQVRGEWANFWLFFFWGGGGGESPQNPVKKTLPTDQTLMENFDGSRKIPGGVSGGKVHFFSILTPLKQLKPQ